MQKPGLLFGNASVAAETKAEAPAYRFGSSRIYYDNFAGQLLNRYNPNMIHLEAPYRYSDEDWFQTIDMVLDFDFTAFEFWLVPALFSRAGLESDFGREFIRQMNAVIHYAAGRGLPVYALASLATVGSAWRTLCPRVKEDWQELRFLWDAWTRRLPELGGVEIFPGDPGTCSRNGCTAETYIDKSVEIAELIRGNLPAAKILFNTWGPPFFGWGILKTPKGWKGEFLTADIASAWKFSKARAARSMTHLLKRLPDFPEETTVALNMGFNPNGNPVGDMDARGWAAEIGKTNPIQSWDFSLTEGENSILPHYRLKRLFERRREEREAAPYSGGICFTMTPKLNQLSHYAAAQSFLRPEADHTTVAGEFCEKVFGPTGKELVPYLQLLEVTKDWGSYVDIDLPREEYHRKMAELTDLLEGLAGQERTDLKFYPTPPEYRQELLYFARLFAKLSNSSPDFDQEQEKYKNHIYGIYNQLPRHVDHRPDTATKLVFNFFRQLANKKPS